MTWSAPPELVQWFDRSSAAYEIEGGLQNLDEMIFILRIMSDLAPDAWQRIQAENDLGNKLAARFRMLGKTEDIDLAIALGESVLDRFPIGHERSMYVNNLASRYALRYEDNSDEVDLIRAIDLGEAAQLVAIGEQHLSAYQINLAMIYFQSYKHRAHAEDLSRAIQIATMAIAQAEKDGERCQYTERCVRYLIERFKLNAVVEDLEYATDLFLGNLKDTLPDDRHDYASTAHTLGELNRETGLPGSLDRAIVLYEQAFALSSTDEDRAYSASNLGIMLTYRYADQGRREDLDLGQHYLLLSVDLIKPERRFLLLVNLAENYAHRYESSLDLADLDICIRLLEEAIGCGPRPIWSEVLESLSVRRERRRGSIQQSPDQHQAKLAEAGLSPEGSNFRKRLVDRFQSEFLNLENSVQVAEMALAVSNSGPDRVAACYLLAKALRFTFSTSGDIRVLDRAIGILEESVLSDTSDEPLVSLCLTELALSMTDRYRNNLVHYDLDSALESAENALMIAQAYGLPDMRSYIDTLAWVLRCRYHDSGQIEDLNRAIEVGESLMLLAQSDFDHAKTLDTLAGCLVDRYKREGAPDDLDRAISLGEEALELGEGSDHVLLGNLATHLSMRFNRTKNIGDVDRAIQFAERAVEGAQGDIAWPARADGLAGYLAARSADTGGDEIDRAIALGRRAVAAALPNSTTYRLCADNLASYLLARFGRNERTADLAEAIEVCEVLIGPISVGRERSPYLLNLAGALFARFTTFGDTTDLDRSVEYLQEIVEFVGESDLHRSLLAIRTLVVLSVATGRDDDAVLAARSGLTVVERLQETLGAQIQEWLHLLQGVTFRGAYALARRGEFTAAADLVERGQGVLAEERLRGAKCTLERAQSSYPELVASYQRCQRIVSSLVEQGAVDRDASEQFALAIADLGNAREALESQSGVGELILRSGVSTAVQVAGRTSEPVCYLVATEIGGMALLVEASGVVRAIDLPTLNDDFVDSCCRRLTEVGLAFGRHGTRAMAKPRSRQVNEQTLDREFVVANVVAELRETLKKLPNGPLRLVPTGRLALLPLTAALIRDGQGTRPISVAVSSRLHMIACNNAAVDRGHSVSALAAPIPCTWEDGLPASPLLGAEREARWLGSTFGTIPLVGSEATRTALRDLLGESHYGVHLGVHGSVDPLVPERTCVILADGPDGLAERLFIGDLIGTNLSVRLIFLAACWLGLSGRELPDEAIGFPTLFCEAGVGAVIAPLWPVGDEATYRFVLLFYAKLAQSYSPSVALALAQSEADPADIASWAAFVLTGA